MSRSAIEQARRVITENAKREYEARTDLFLKVLAVHPNPTIIRDAKGTHLQDRKLQGPLVFLGGEQIMVNGCLFTTDPEPAPGVAYRIPNDD